MPKCLKKVGSNNLYHFVEGKKVNGKTTMMTDNRIDLYGDCSGLRGNCTDLSGNCSDLTGNCTDLRGNCTGLRGDLDEITADERKEFPDIGHWIEA